MYTGTIYNNIHCPKYFSDRYNIECSKIQPRNRILFNSKSCGSLHIYIPRIFVLKNDVIIFIQYFFFFACLYSVSDTRYYSFEGWRIFMPSVVFGMLVILV